jgi:hypothetical protein
MSRGCWDIRKYCVGRRLRWKKCVGDGKNVWKRGEDFFKFKISIRMTLRGLVLSKLR